MAKHSPLPVPLIIGQDVSLAIPITGDDDQPLSMAGATLEMVVRKSPANATVLITKSGAAITLSDSDTGDGVTDDQVNVAIARADTIDAQGVPLFGPGLYFYTLRKTNAGDAAPLAYGAFPVRYAATR